MLFLKVYLINLTCRCKLIITSGVSEALVRLTRKVAAAPTTVAAIATEAAVSGRAEDTVNVFLPGSCDFPSLNGQELCLKSLIALKQQK